VQGNAKKLYSIRRSIFILDWKCSAGNRIRKKINTQNETENVARELYCS
jgi:hypothetical protein